MSKPRDNFFSLVRAANLSTVVCVILMNILHFHFLAYLYMLSPTLVKPHGIMNIFHHLMLHLTWDHVVVTS